jgi:NAD(P)-dependent dehydrogenase (short-subunit alcohol dehydrogenase family)
VNEPSTPAAGGGLNERIFRLDARVAVVTGGTGGIGAAICRLFANVGAAVACLDLDAGKAQATAAAIEAEGGRAIGIGCDVAREEDTVAAVRRVRDELGPPTVLVNSVAAPDRTGSVLEIDLAEWENVHRVNLTGAFLMSRAVLPHMVQAGRGSIINVASVLGHVAHRGRISYSSTKGALLQMTRVMALDHGPQGIRVNTLSPGPVDTPRIGMRQDSMTAQEKEAAMAKFLFRRLGRPEEMATAALFLASDASSFVTGTDLLADGGYIVSLS